MDNYFWKNIIYHIIGPLVGTFVGSGFTILVFLIKNKVEQKKVQRNAILALKIELTENEIIVNNYLENIKSKGIGTKNMHIQLSNSSWLNLRHEVSKFGQEKIASLCSLYAEILKINNLAASALSYANSNLRDEFPTRVHESVKNVQELLKKGLESINNLIISV